MGTMMLNALSLSTVLFAIRASCLFSETAIVNPSLLLTCSITWTSELPSPITAVRDGPLSGSEKPLMQNCRRWFLNPPQVKKFYAYGLLGKWQAGRLVK